MRLVQGDATDAANVARVSRGADAVVSAISPRPNARGLGAPSLAAAARAARRRARGARAAPRRGRRRGDARGRARRRLLDTPGFPAAYRAEAGEGAASLAALRGEGAGVDWTFLSPAAEVGPGDRTGTYRTTGDTSLADAAGRSFITSEDYAVALVDELERPQHVGRRFGVAY